MYPEPRVTQFVSDNFTPVRLHVKTHPEAMERFNAQWTPTIVMLDSSGIERHRIEGYLDADEFLGQLMLGAGHIAFGEKRFDDAERRFREIVEKLPNTDAAPAAQYWAGVSKYKGTNDGSALAATGRPSSSATLIRRGRRRRASGPHDKTMRIGIIADTHGLVRPEVARAFAGVDHIVHAGDVGGDHVLAALRAIAPVTFVGGNNDDGSEGLDVIRVRLGDVRILLTHILPKPRKPASRVVASLRNEPADFVIFGHSHLPHDEVLDGVRFFNPASAGPRRFDYPVAVGVIDGRDAAHIPLDERSILSIQTRMNQLSRH